DGPAVRMRAVFGGERDVREALAVEVRAHQPRDPLGILVRHEPEVDFPGRLGGDHRLGARAVVARFDSADVASGLEDRRALSLIIAPTEGEPLDADDALDRLG